MKKSIALGLLGIVSVLWISTGSMAMASTNACTHPNSKIIGREAGHWDVSHYETLSESAGSEWCSATHWVIEEYLYCPDCGHSVLWETYHHERHSLCGKNY